MTNRRAARELLMRLIYQMSVTGDWSEEEEAAFLAENAADDRRDFVPAAKVDKAYFDKIIKIVRDNRDAVDRAVANASDNWKIGRIAKVDLAIIRLAAAEILYADDIPAAVSINEAVDLAKRYGSDKSYEFVNGVLGRIVRNLPAEAETETAGRAEGEEQ
jgi:N utilization substance protein B